MSSAAFPDIKLNYTRVSPQLSESINDYLVIFTKLHSLLLEVVEKVSNIHTVAATELLAVAETFNKRITEITKGKPNSPSESIVKFLNRFLEQIQSQGKILQNLKASFCDCVVIPLQEAVDKKKEVWKTCYHYADTFVHQINKKDDDLQKRHKDYSDAAMKVKPGNRKDKQVQIFHDSHNTYLLRLSSVNSINNLLYTHVLPHTLHSIEINQCELNDQVRHHVKYLFSVQKDTMKKLIRSVDKIDHAADKIDLVSDLKKFIKLSNKGMKDKSPPCFKFTLPKVDPSKIAVLDNIDGNFIINKRTQPNLQRRLASLQQQTEQLVDSIATMRSEGSEEHMNQCEDPSLNELIEFLSICDKEANLNVLLKQMELYTPKVVDFLGPMPHNLLSEQKHSNKTSEEVHTEQSVQNGEQPHQFVEPRVMKPISCFYCGKMIALIGKGFICKVCKLSVHKKCATNVQFCQPILHEVQNSSLFSSGKAPIKFEAMATMESSAVYDLIDLESDDDYYDVDEFDDGLSDDSEYNEQNTTNFHPCNKSLRPEKPGLLPKPNILQSPLVKVLPDLLSSNEAMGGFQPISPNPVMPVTGKKPGIVHTSKSFSAGTSAPRTQLHHKTSVGYCKRSSVQETSTKPLIAKKPIIEKPTINSAQPSICSKPNIKSNKPTICQKKGTDNYLDKTQKPPPLAKKPNMINSQKQKIFCVSLYDYSGNKDTDLSFVCGCKIEITEKTNDEWWYGVSNGYEGYFPSQYVLEIKQNDCIMRALFQFNKESESELDIDEGAILVLIQDEDDWVMVRSKDGEGLVPTSYVEQVGNQSIC